MDDTIDMILKNYRDVCMQTRDKLHLEGDVNIDKLIVGTKEAKKAIKDLMLDIDSICENPDRYDKLEKHQAKILLDYHEDCIKKLRQQLRQKIEEL